MRPIPPALKKLIESDPAMRICIYHNADCRDEFGRRPARAEWEHAFIYAGKQINEWWAIIGVCWYHHRGPGLDKGFNQYKCLERMSESDLDEAERKYPGTKWRSIRERLRKKYYGK
jgi:hypothetical protein